MIEHLECRAVTQRWATKYALFEISFEATRGRACAILGPNGCGKTTLLELLSLVHRPTCGTIVYRDNKDNPLDSRQVRGNLGLLSHEPMLYGELSALENLIFFSRLSGLNDPRSAAQTYLSQVGLHPDDQRSVSRLSHGVGRRVALARALLGGQSVLLLDEPENGLDADGHQQIIDVLRDLSQKKIVVFTTHDLALALALADRLLILHQGRVACMLDSAGLTVASLRAALRRPNHTNRDATLAERLR